MLRQRAIDVHFSVPKDNAAEADPNQGTLVVFNMDASVPRQAVHDLFARYGEVKDVRSTPRKDGHKFVEFYDSRHAAHALQGTRLRYRCLYCATLLYIALDALRDTCLLQCSASAVAAASAHAVNCFIPFSVALHMIRGSEHCSNLFAGLNRAVVAGKQLKIELSRPGGIRRARNSNPNLVALASGDAGGGGAPHGHNMAAPVATSGVGGAGGTHMHSSSAAALPVGDAARVPSAADLQSMFSSMMLKGASEPNLAMNAAAAPGARFGGGVAPPPPPPLRNAGDGSVAGSAHAYSASGHSTASPNAQQSQNEGHGSGIAQAGAVAESDMSGKASVIRPSDSASSVNSVYNTLLRQFAADSGGAGAAATREGLQSLYQNVFEQLLHGPGPVHGTARDAVAAPPPPPPQPAGDTAPAQNLPATLAASAAAAMAALNRDGSVPAEEHEARLHQHLLEQLSRMQRHAHGQAAAEGVQLRRGSSGAPPPPPPPPHAPPHPSASGPELHRGGAGGGGDFATSPCASPGGGCGSGMLSSSPATPRALALRHGRALSDANSQGPSGAVRRSRRTRSFACHMHCLNGGS